MNKKERQERLISNEDGKNLSSKVIFNKILKERCKETLMFQYAITKL